MSRQTANDRIRGGLLGLSLGDALGAPLEGGPIERLAWLFITSATRTKLRWTDDTQMSLDLAESLAASGSLDLDDVARRFAQGYHWSRGYGPAAARMLKRIRHGIDWREANRSIYPNGSFGNGAAMRSPVIGIFYRNRPAELPTAASGVASITHAHALGIEGAVLIAVATLEALHAHGPAEIMRRVAAHSDSEPFRCRIEIACRWLEDRELPPASEVRSKLGNGVAAAESCITALYIAMRFLNTSFEDMIRFIAECRGDVDTIGAMAGGIWGAANGVSQLPPEKIDILEQRDRIIAAADALSDASVS
jgi:poly(ADP-ribose) glycohydrolase ARH3